MLSFSFLFGVASAFSFILSSIMWIRSARVKNHGNYDFGEFDVQQENIIESFDNRFFLKKLFWPYESPKTRFDSIYISSYFNKYAAFLSAFGAFFAALQQFTAAPLNFF